MLDLGLTFGGSYTLGKSYTPFKSDKRNNNHTIITPQELLNQGMTAKYSDSPHKGWTALHFAAAEGHVHLVEALLASGNKETLPVYALQGHEEMWKGKY